MSQVVVELLNMMGRYQSYGDDQGIVFTDTSLFVKDDTTDGTLGTFLFGLDITAFGGERDDLFASGRNIFSTDNRRTGIPVGADSSSVGAGTARGCWAVGADPTALVTAVNSR